MTNAESWDHVARNLAHIRATMAEAAQRAGRDPESVRLVAVTKTFPVEAVRAAIAAGQTRFGENTVQEGLAKMQAVQGAAGATGDGGAEFHLIGHLQTNKARHAGAFAMVESVDSVRVARAISRRLEAPLPILLEVNVAGEESKYGFAPGEVRAALAAVASLPNIEVRGLMTVAPLAADAEETRPVFRALRELRDALGLTELSMGMTNDFPVAIEEGATLVRIGRAIFGDRWGPDR